MFTDLIKSTQYKIALPINHLKRFLAKLPMTTFDSPRRIESADADGAHF
jgi:hypothetical protein